MNIEGLGNNKQLQLLLQQDPQKLALKLRMDLFKSGNFDFIVKGKDKNGKDFEHKKQREALEILTSNKYKEFMFGGAANGAKTWTGCTWLLFMCLLHPGTKWFVARNQLKDLKESVLDTFGKVANEYGYSDYTFNGVDYFIKFHNNSKILFKEISYKPSDPLYEKLGSTEYTGGWIEESGEIDQMGAQVISKRAGRHYNDKYNLNKIIFYTCNPKKNWNKTEFYDKWKNGTLESHKYFLPSLVIDNPFREEGTLEDLESYRDTNKVLYERLYKGNWDYEDNPYQLADQEKIDMVFDNDHVEEGKSYLTADIARYGADKAVFIAWKGWVAKEVITLDKSSLQDNVLAIQSLRKKYGIPPNRCIADADGVGGFVIDATKILSFNNGKPPIKVGKDKPNFRNLQVQCLYLLADKINDQEIFIDDYDLGEKVKEMIKEEFAQIQSIPSKRDSEKLDAKIKSDIRRDLNRSPDYRDAFFMRVYFDLKKEKKSLVVKWR